MRCYLERLLHPVQGRDIWQDQKITGCGFGSFVVRAGGGGAEVRVRPWPAEVLAVQTQRGGSNAMLLRMVTPYGPSTVD